MAKAKVVSTIRVNVTAKDITAGIGDASTPG